MLSLTGEMMKGCCGSCGSEVFVFPTVLPFSVLDATEHQVRSVVLSVFERMLSEGTKLVYSEFTIHEISNRVQAALADLPRTPSQTVWFAWRCDNHGCPEYGAVTFVPASEAEISPCPSSTPKSV